jgi:acyl-CoA reductase-like NAD-dependent aldehyde dehydrogenase
VATIEERRTYVAGDWAAGDEVLAVVNPADETHVAGVHVTPLAGIDRAVLEARRSFEEGVWADRPATQRAEVLRAFLDHV